MVITTLMLTLLPRRPTFNCNRSMTRGDPFVQDTWRLPTRVSAHEKEKNRSTFEQLPLDLSRPWSPRPQVFHLPYPPLHSLFYPFLKLSHDDVLLDVEKNVKNFFYLLHFYTCDAPSRVLLRNVQSARSPGTFDVWVPPDESVEVHDDRNAVSARTLKVNVFHGEVQLWGPPGSVGHRRELRERPR